MALIISISQFKGGCGKTTIAVNLAAGCARAGLRTVLVETDGQGNASQSMGVKPHNGFHDLMYGAALDTVLVEAPKPFHELGDLALISASNLQQEVESDPDTPARVMNRFYDLRQMADVVIVDTSPGNTEVHAGIFYAADYMLIPTLCDFLSLRSLSTTLYHRDYAIELTKDSAYNVATILGIIPNRFQAREDVQQANLSILHREYGDSIHIFEVMRDLTAWRQASQMRRSIYTYSPLMGYARKRVQVAARELDPVLNAVLNLVGVTAYE